jgi:sarcosine oxidase
MNVIVVGLGAMGSSAAMHCARRGARVRGFEQFGRGHSLGSSSGKSRIIRQAYYEDTAYVPLLLRAYELWDELERLTNESIVHLVGMLIAGNERSAILRGTLAVAREHVLNVEALDAGELRARYPALRVEAGEVALLERRGGFLVPEVAIRALQRAAEGAGAELQFDVAMERWTSGPGGVEVFLTGGATARADALVLALGPWFEETMRAAEVALRVQRNVQVWFSPATVAFDATRFPAFLVDRAALPAPLYGFPDLGDGVKAAFHGFGAATHAQTLDRNIDRARDVFPVARALEAWMPGAAASYRDAMACMYSLTPDGHFVIDRYPGQGNVVVCGGFSGHGFKFASVVGEIVADLVLDGDTRHRIDFLRADRFARRRDAARDR